MENYKCSWELSERRYKVQFLFSKNHKKIRGTDFYKTNIKPTTTLRSVCASWNCFSLESSDFLAVFFWRIISPKTTFCSRIVDGDKRGNGCWFLVVSYVSDVLLIPEQCTKIVWGTWDIIQYVTCLQWILLKVADCSNRFTAWTRKVFCLSVSNRLLWLLKLRTLSNKIQPD